MAPDEAKSRNERLRRVVILCCSFARNLAYYRVGRKAEYRHLLDPATNASAPFWRAVNANFVDMGVIEWCKLFADTKGKHYWKKIVNDSEHFETDLLQHVGLDAEAFEREIDAMRRYRDKFLAHLDSDATMNIPRLDVPKKAVWFYHAHIVNNEVGPGDLWGLCQEIETGYQATENEAASVYQRNG